MSDDHSDDERQREQDIGDDNEDAESVDSSSSNESVEELYQIFEATDRDGDGVITLDEMLEMERTLCHQRGEVFNETQKREELEKFLSDADMNADHVLDFHEFLLAMRARESDDPRKRPTARAPKVKTKAPGKQNFVNMMKPSHPFLSPQEEKTWDQEKQKVIDVNDPTTRQRIEQIFNSVDVQGRQMVHVNALLQIDKHISDLRGKKFEEEKRTKELFASIISNAKPEDGKSTKAEMGLEDFVTFVDTQKWTKAELKDTSETIWRQIQLEQDKQNMVGLSVTDLKQSVEGLRSQVMNAALVVAKKQARQPNPAAKDEPEVVENEMGDQLAASQKQLSSAMGMADQLLQKYDQAQKRIVELQQQIKNAQQGKPIDTKAQKERTDRERNQEFFFLTALAVKTNLDARSKALNLPSPPFPPTKILYDEAMAQKVQFQNYQKWLMARLNPVAASASSRARAISTRPNANPNANPNPSA